MFDSLAALCLALLNRFEHEFPRNARVLVNESMKESIIGFVLLYGGNCDARCGWVFAHKYPSFYKSNQYWHKF